MRFVLKVRLIIVHILLLMLLNILLIGKLCWVRVSSLLLHGGDDGLSLIKLVKSVIIRVILKALVYIRAIEHKLGLGWLELFWKLDVALMVFNLKFWYVYLHKFGLRL